MENCEFVFFGCFVGSALIALSLSCCCSLLMRPKPEKAFCPEDCSDSSDDEKEKEN